MTRLDSDTSHHGNEYCKARLDHQTATPLRIHFLISDRIFAHSIFSMASSVLHFLLQSKWYQSHRQHRLQMKLHCPCHSESLCSGHLRFHHQCCRCALVMVIGNEADLMPACHDCGWRWWRALLGMVLFVDGLSAGFACEAHQHTHTLILWARRQAVMKPNVRAHTSNTTISSSLFFQDPESNGFQCVVVRREESSSGNSGCTHDHRPKGYPCPPDQTRPTCLWRFGWNPRFTETFSGVATTATTEAGSLAYWAIPT